MEVVAVWRVAQIRVGIVIHAECSSDGGFSGGFFALRRRSGEAVRWCRIGCGHFELVKKGSLWYGNTQLSRIRAVINVLRFSVFVLELHMSDME